MPRRLRDDDDRLAERNDPVGQNQADRVGSSRGRFRSGTPGVERSSSGPRSRPGGRRGEVIQDIAAEVAAELDFGQAVGPGLLVAVPIATDVDLL